MQEQKHTAIGFFDLEDAYNRVDISVLARKMITMGISRTLTRWILALLGCRMCCMRFGTWTSDPFAVSSGLPQGSPLSSVLFNIYTADIIPSLWTNSATGSTYVDDIIGKRRRHTAQSSGGPPASQQCTRGVDRPQQHADPRRQEYVDVGKPRPSTRAFPDHIWRC